MCLIVKSRFPLAACNQLTRAAQVLTRRGEAPSLANSLAHISLLYSQSRNKWSLVSESRLHSTQVSGTSMPHVTSFCLTGSLSRCATQNVKACFGMQPLNQTDWVHMSLGCFGRRCSQVKPEEKTEDTMPGISHENTSGPWDWVGRGWAVKWSRTSATLLCLTRCEGSLQESKIDFTWKCFLVDWLFFSWLICMKVPKSFVEPFLVG